MNTFFSVLSPILAILSLAVSGYCIWQIGNFNKLKKTFFTGSNGADIESAVYEIGAKAENLEKELNMLLLEIQKILHNQSFAIQKIGVVKFNPFSDSGGNFSFSLALLDQHNSGIILTSMHGREQNRIYTKIVLGGKSESKLTEEEQRAVLEAEGKYQALIKK